MRLTFKVPPRLWVSIFALALLLAACSGGGAPASQESGQQTSESQTQSPPDTGEPQEESLEELAKKEGTLTWYTVAPIEAVTALAEAFTAETGITVEVFRQTAGPLTETFYADDSRNDTKADVLDHSEGSTVIRMGNEGLLTKYESTQSDKFPADALETLHGYAYPDRLILLTVTYNSDLVTAEEEELIKSDPYGALIDSRFKGYVSFPDPNLNGTSFNHLYMVGLSKGGWDSPEAKAWYEALAANEPMLFNSAGPVADALVSGEAKISMMLEAFSNPLIKQGAPLVNIYPEPTFAMLGATGIVTKAPHPNAARYFLDWLLSKHGQEKWNQIYDVAVLNSEAEDQRDYLFEHSWYDPPTELFFVPDLLKQDEDRTPFLEFFSETFGL